jgi:hypothetical protein
MADLGQRAKAPASALALAAVLLSLAAFGSSRSDAANGTAAAAPVRAAASPPAAPAARSAPVTLGPTAPAGRAATARRCGWLHNPTPGNWWLIDRDGEWVLATQGGDQAPGLDSMPDMTTAGWAEVNGHYGYGCACATITGDPATRRVERASRFEPRPLRLCRSDPALPPP